MESNKPRNEILNLIEKIIKKESFTSLPNNWRDILLVTSMNDGGMGSLKLSYEGFENKNRKYGKQVGEYIFADSDGIPVIITLNVDQFNNLFELDIWKTDFNKLNQFPI